MSQQAHRAPAAQSGVSVLASLLRRYCFAYTASHDSSVCDDIMVEQYTLHMGGLEIRGRDESYKPAAEKQYRQFPGLGLSVHDLLITPQRAALHFSEYGRSVLTGSAAAWNGISLYHWDGHRLTDCRVEQDYYSRRRQLRSGEPNAIDAVAHDPWTQRIERPDPQVEAATRAWLSGNGLGALAIGSLDDEPAAPPERVVLDRTEIAILDCFAGEQRAAFHVRAAGVVAELPGCADTVGVPATVYYAGIAHVRSGQVVGARVVSDRLAAQRRLPASPPDRPTG